MDDLLNWDSQDTSKSKEQHGSLQSFAALRPTPPISGRSTPLPKSGSNVNSRTQTPANDSFSNLLSFKPTAPKILTLEEQLREKTKLDAAKIKQAQSQYGDNEQFWTSLEGKRSGSERQPSLNNRHADWGRTNPSTDEDDLLAAFSADARVDSSTHFPKPTSQHQSSSNSKSQVVPPRMVVSVGPKSSDDDPFGLGQTPHSQSHAKDEDDDVLGLLAHPVSRVSVKPEAVEPLVSAHSHPQDKALAEIMEMGFSAERAKEALESTESGTDVSQAVGWLLNKAHTDAKEELQSKKEPRSPQRNDQGLSRDGSAQSVRGSAAEPAWARSRERKPDASPEAREKQPNQNAPDIGQSLFQKAGSLFNKSSKIVQQAVNDFNSDSDSSQPKWMQTGPSSRQVPRPEGKKPTSAKKHTSVTDEALMLESDGGRPRRIPKRVEANLASSADSSRDHSPVVPSRLRPDTQPPAFRQQPDKRPDPKRFLSRDHIEAEAAQAYTSSARRRRPPGQAVAASEPNLFDTEAIADPKPLEIPKRRPASPQPLPTVRSPPSTRQIPPVSSTALQASHTAREAGNAHFKRGDFAAAHSAYTTALTPLPATHPLRIPLLTNRSLTSLKTGSPKPAITDADAALTLIGPSHGESELIPLLPTPKPMGEYFGKVLARKAEALEQIERWADAATVWRLAIESGHASALSIEGRKRCEKALNPSPAPPPPARPVKPQKPPAPRSARARPVADPSFSSSPTAAVSSLRAANRAAEQVEDEKFALADAVEARLAAWKGSKADNLRALLGSLDKVLWDGAGWTKVGMAELVLPGRVKVVYMKGIARVHPDKIPTTATTEQRMIAGAVFSTLNEAWDKFKAENGL